MSTCVDWSNLANCPSGTVNCNAGNITLENNENFQVYSCICQDDRLITNIQNDNCQVDQIPSDQQTQIQNDPQNFLKITGCETIIKFTDREKICRCKNGENINILQNQLLNDTINCKNPVLYNISQRNYYEKNRKNPKTFLGPIIFGTILGITLSTLIIITFTYKPKDILL
jgi:hypothetical protein